MPGEGTFVSKETKRKTFVIEKVFMHQIGKIKLYLWEDFQKLLWRSKKTDRIVVEEDKIPKLSNLVLLHNTKEVCLPGVKNPISEETFWRILYFMIIEHERGEEILGIKIDKNNAYIMHVRNDDGEVLDFTMFYEEHDGWNLGASLVSGTVCRGYIYLYINQ